MDSRRRTEGSYPDSFRRTLGSGWTGSQSSWGCRGRSSPTASASRTTA